MNYRRNNTSRYVYGGVGAGVLIVLLFFYGGIFSVFVSRTLHAVAYPFWKIGNSLSDAGSFTSTFFSEKIELVQRNRALEDEVALLRLEQSTLKVFQSENTELKALFKDIHPEDFTVAPVLVRPPRSAYDTLVIDVGESNTVQKGMYVYAGNTAVLGTVSEVYGHTALVTLFSSQGVETPVLVGTERTEFIAKGDGGGTFIVHVPKDFSVQTGDEVILPTAKVSLVGTVDAIENEAHDPDKRLFVHLERNPFSLRFVNILLTQ